MIIEIEREVNNMYEIRTFFSSVELDDLDIAIALFNEKCKTRNYVELLEINHDWHGNRIAHSLKIFHN